MIGLWNLENYSQLNRMCTQKKKSLKQNSMKRNELRDEQTKAGNLRLVPSFQSQIKLSSTEDGTQWLWGHSAAGGFYD